AARAPVTLLVPGVAPGPAFAHARATLASWAGADAVKTAMEAASLRPAGSGDGPFVSRANLLYDDAAVLPNAIAPAPALEAFSAPGAESELEAAGRRALAFIARPAVRGGPVAPHEIAIVSRTLEPYAALLEPILARDL